MLCVRTLAAFPDDATVVKVSGLCVILVAQITISHRGQIGFHEERCERLPEFALIGHRAYVLLLSDIKSPSTVHLLHYQYTVSRIEMKRGLMFRNSNQGGYPKKIARKSVGEASASAG